MFNFLIVIYVLFSVFCVLFVCKCVLFYCHRVSTQLQLNIHIVSYRIKRRTGEILRFCIIIMCVCSVQYMKNVFPRLSNVRSHYLDPFDTVIVVSWIYFTDLPMLPLNQDLKRASNWLGVLISVPNSARNIEARWPGTILRVTVMDTRLYEIGLNCCMQGQ
jgi:hypothetical protein